MNNIKRILELLLHPKRLFWAVAFRLPLKRRFNGELIRLPTYAGKKFQPLVDNRYEVEECEALKVLGERGWNFVDIGANIGVITVMMSKIAGSSGSVLAYEPNPLAYSQLKETILLNNCVNTECVNKLVSEAISTESINISEEGGLGVRSSMITKDPGSKAILLPSVTIDSMIVANGEIDYIKIDAEGAEYRIISGAAQTLKTSRPLLQIEVHGQYLRQAGVSVGKLIELVTCNDYVCVNIATWSEFDLEEYMKCTHCHAPDTFTCKDMAYEGYGQLIFVPSEKKYLLKNIRPRACPICSKG